MKAFWENDSDPLPEGHKHAGQFAAVVDLEDGTPPSIYYGATHKEVADKLLVAQTNAAQRIAQLRTQVPQESPDLATQPRKVGRRPLSADERMQIAADMSDPARAPEAIRAVVEAEVGAPLEQVSARLSEEEEERQAQEAATEARAFAEATPEWWPSDHNKDLLRSYIHARGWAWSRKNFGIAFEALKKAGLVEFKPEPIEELEPAPTGAQPTSQAEPIAPVSTTRPRGTTRSTGMRSTDASGYGGGRTAPKYTRAMVERMSIAEYNEKLASDPEFKAFISALDNPQATAARQ